MLNPHRALRWRTDLKNAPTSTGDDDTVLVTARNRETGIVFVGEAYLDSRDSSEGWWWVNTGPGDYGAEVITQVCDVLAWSPMPEPYKP